MKKKIRSALGCAVLLLILILLGFGIPWFFADENGDLPDVWGISEAVIKVQDLPDKPFLFSQSAGKFVDLGYRYSTGYLCFIPMFSYGGTWCGYIDEKQFIRWTPDHLNDVLKQTGISLPPEPFLGWWRTYFGKMAFLLILLAALLNKGSSGCSRKNMNE